MSLHPITLKRRVYGNAETIGSTRLMNGKPSQKRRRIRQIGKRTWIGKTVSINDANSLFIKVLTRINSCDCRNVWRCELGWSRWEIINATANERNSKSWGVTAQAFRINWWSLKQIDTVLFGLYSIKLNRVLILVNCEWSYLLFLSRCWFQLHNLCRISRRVQFREQ